ncbi:unnamed protein product, partial [Scytosiphon promiscuus]
MIHKRRTLPCAQSIVELGNGEQKRAAGSTSVGGRLVGNNFAAPRFDCPAGDDKACVGGGGRLSRTGDIAGCCSSTPAAVQRKRRRGPASSKISATRSFWFRALCLTGGGFLIVMAAVRRRGLSPWSRRLPRQDAVAYGARDAEFDLQHLPTTKTKYTSFRPKPYTLAGLLELKSDFSPHESEYADVTAILMASPSLDAQLNALLQSSVQATQVWVAMPATGTSDYRAIVTAYQKNAKFGKRLHMVKSDLFSELPPGATGGAGPRGDGVGHGDDDDDDDGDGDGDGDGKSGKGRGGGRSGDGSGGGSGGGGSDGGRFFDDKAGLFQLSMQAETTYVWVIDEGVLPGRKFLQLLAHVSLVRDMHGVYGHEGGLMPPAHTRAWRIHNTDDSFVRRPALFDHVTVVLETVMTSIEPLLSLSATPSLTAHSFISLTMDVDCSRKGVSSMMEGLAQHDRRESGIAVVVLSPVDVLFSQWFLHRDLVRLLFREKWAAVGSRGHGDSAGLALSYSVRRYASLPSYVLPSDPALPEFSGDTRLSPSAAAAAAAARGGQPPREMTATGRASRAATAASRTSDTSKKPFGRTGSRGLFPWRARKGSDGAAAAGDAKSAGSRGGSAPAASSEANAAATASLARKIGDPALRAQFRELSARGGQFFWTPEQCPQHLVLVVVDGRRQAELLQPLYRELVAAMSAGAGDSTDSAEVFVAVISHGPDDAGSGGSDPRWREHGTAHSSSARIARRDCTLVAEALGASPVNTAPSNSEPGSRGASSGDGGDSSLDGSIQPPTKLTAAVVGGGGEEGAPTTWAEQFARWFAGNERRSDEWRRQHSLNTDEFCLGDAFGVFHVRVGQDYHQAAGRPLDPYLEVFHGLSEVLEIVKPKIVAYIASPHEARTETQTHTDARPVDKGKRKDLDALLAGAVPTSYAPEETVVRAVEAAVRSAGGGSGAPPRPIGVGLPGTAAVEAAGAAKALAYLPGGCLERWSKPDITILLVHGRGQTASSLASTLASVSDAYYLGDSVDLRLVLSSGFAGDPEIDHILSELEWKSGTLDVTYSSDAVELPAGVAALEAFSDPGVHSHVIPLFSGARLHPQFYVWLKVALMNDGYAPQPKPGVSASPPGLRRSLALGFGFAREGDGLGAGAGAGAGAGGGGSRGGGDLRNPLGNSDKYKNKNEIAGDFQVGAPARKRATTATEEGKKLWGKFLALSVNSPPELCSVLGDGGGGCSRVWMYGSESWASLRERCRVGLVAAAAAAAGGAAGGAASGVDGSGGGGDGVGGARRRQGELDPVEVACA